MSSSRKRRRRRPPSRVETDKAPEPGRKRRQRPPAPQPADVVDGIPDRARRSPRWLWLVLAGGFVLWLAFLVYAATAGAVE